MNLEEFLLHNAHPVGEKLEMPKGAAKYSEANVYSLVEMGFSENAAKRALIKTKDNLEAATMWIMENMDDPTLHDPIEEEPPKTSGVNFDLIPKIL